MAATVNVVDKHISMNILLCAILLISLNIDKLDTFFKNYYAFVYFCLFRRFDLYRFINACAEDIMRKGSNCYHIL